MTNTAYTYTIFDGNPASSGNCSWPSHENVEIKSDTAENALAEALSQAEEQGTACGEYDDGDRLWAIVWDADGVVSAQGSVALRIEA